MTVPLLAYNFLMLSCCKSSWKYEVEHFKAVSALTMKPSQETPTLLCYISYLFIPLVQ